MQMKKSVLTMVAMAAGMAALGGCATKGFVRDQVAVVDEKVVATDTRVASAEGRLTTVEGTAKEALDRATAAGKLAEGKFLYEQVLADDGIKFQSGKWILTSEGEARLLEVANRLKSENRNVYVEIQGHTDSTGADNYNLKLGEERAEAVRRFLAEQGLALNRMATISYGEKHPVAPNDSRDGRAQNRRVALVVLA